MRAIDPHSFWIGNAHDARNPRLLYQTGIRAVIDLAAEESPAQLGRDLIYCRIPLLDSPENHPEDLRLAVQIFTQLLSTATPTLLACSAGMSRSPAIAAVGLNQVFGILLPESLKMIRQAGPCDISPGLWNDICQIFVG